MAVASTRDDKKSTGDKADKKVKTAKGAGSALVEVIRTTTDEKKADENRQQRKRDFFRRLERGIKRRTKNKASSTDDDSSSESGGFFRRILRSRSGEEERGVDGSKQAVKKDKKENRTGLPSVDINAFVGPRMPDIGSELGVRDVLNLTPEEIARKEKARLAMELAKVKRIEAQKQKEERIRAAKERAEKLAEERRLAEQKKKEILERQRAVREAAKTKPGAASTSSKGGTDEKADADEKGRRWPNFSFGGDKDKDKDKAAEEDTKPKLGGVFGGISGMFGGGAEKEQEGEWIVVCPKTRIAPGVVVPIVAGGLDLLIVASKDGKRLACISNSCPHLGTPLETGIIERRPATGAAARKPDLADDGCEDCIVCPTHNTAFALASGEVRGEWCPYPPVLGAVMGTVKPIANLPTFQIRARGKNIEVRLASSLDDIKERK